MGELFVCLLFALILFGFFTIVNSQNMFVSNGEVPVKGGTIQIVCQRMVFGQQLTSIIKSQTAAYIGTQALEICLENGCSGAYYPRYRFQATQSDITITISSLAINEDQQWWSCVGGQTVVQLFLTVYSLPKSLSFTETTSKDVNLANTSVTFRCQTDCSNPDPNIKWFFTQVGQPKTQWSGTTVTTNNTNASCQNSEKIYISTLLLPKFTTMSDNSDTYGTFECTVLKLPGMAEDLCSGISHNIAFAVQVTSASLREGNSNIIEVIVGESTTLNCILSNSKPAATVVWYVGGVEKQSNTSTVFTFIPYENDHNKTVYCKAFNFENQNLAVFSGKPNLYVKVTVARAIIMDGALNPTTVIVVTENQPKTLNCLTSTSRPAPTIVWYIKGIERQRSVSNTFTFMPTNDDHNQEIYCKAFNVQPENASVTSKILNLYVKVLASTPTLSNQTPLILLSGDSTTLECLSSNTRPPVTVVWKLNNILLSTFINTNVNVTGELYKVRSVLNITPKNTDNNKVVTCETFIDGQETKPVAEGQLQVYWPPSVPSISPVDNFPWLEGMNNNILNCVSYDVGNPSADAIWNTTVGQPVGEKLRSLQIPFLTSQHNGVIINCSLTNVYTQRKGIHLSARTTLIVEYIPKIQILVDGIVSVNVTRNESNSLSAICTATGNPIPNIQWIGRPGQLVFDDIQRTDDGLYRCAAKAISLKHGTLSSTKELNLIVNYAPYVSVEFSDILKEDVRLTISCRAIGKPGIYTFANLTHTWKGQILQIISLPPDGHFSLPNPTIQDSGNYTCLVSNGVPDRSGIDYQYGTGEAILQGKPKVSKKAQSLFAGKIDEPINITIPFYSYPPVMMVVFRTMNGKNITNTSKYEVTYSKQRIDDDFYLQNVELDGYIAVLHIRKQAEDDFVNYVVDIENEVGMTEWQFRHTSISIPMVPKYFKLSGIENGVPFFILEGGYNGGLPQTFVIETSLAASNNWMERLRIHEDDVQYRLSNGSFLFNISGLGPETYTVRVISENDIGRIDESQGLALDVIIEAAGSRPGNTGAVIGGAVGGGTACVIFIAVVVIFIRRIRMQKGNGEKQLALNNTTAIYTDLQTPQHEYTNMTSEYSELTTRSDRNFDNSVEDPYTEVRLKNSGTEEHVYNAIDSTSKAVPEDAKVYVNLQMSHIHQTS